MTKVIIAVYVGQLSVGPDIVILGERDQATAAYQLWDWYGEGQSVVKPFTPTAQELEWRQFTAMYKVYGFEINDMDHLMRWWYEL